MDGRAANASSLISHRGSHWRDHGAALPACVRPLPHSPTAAEDAQVGLVADREGEHFVHQLIIV